MMRNIVISFPLIHFRSVLVALAVALVALSAMPAEAADFCWKDSYGRGVGTVPKHCSHNQDRIGLLCYSKCEKGTKRFGFDCHSVCPSGFADQGLFCRRSEYGRGAGYPWKFGDGLNDHGMRHRCEHAHGKGNCEKNGAIYYPKCKPGYHSFGCCICRPHVPDCHKLGLNKGIDLSCAKKIHIGHPKTGQCGSGHQKDAGLCYKNCRKGYSGVGPVCWGDKPKGWVNCGMGAAKDSKTCRSIVFDQITSVGSLALNVATLGTSGEVEEAAESGEKTEEISKLEKQYAKMKKVWDEVKESEKVQKAIKAAKKAKDVHDVAWTTYDAVEQGKAATTPEDMTRVAAMIASLVDPTGVAGTISAYDYAKCSAYFK